LQTLEEIAVGQTSEQEAFRIRGVMTLLSILEHEWDASASSRVAGISRYADLVRRGSLLMSGDRRERLRRALRDAGAGAPDLRISALESTLDHLREAIIDLQGWLEESDVPDERQLLADIWQAEYQEAENLSQSVWFW
jgi:hypothetical protein